MRSRQREEADGEALGRPADRHRGGARRRHLDQGGHRAEVPRDGHGRLPAQHAAQLRAGADGGLGKTGRISDLASYQLNAATKTARPYYVRVRVKNVGTGDLSRAGIPLYAVDSRNSLIQSSTFNNNFTKCPSKPLPAGFTADKTFSGCLVYLVPRGATLVEMSYRPLQAFEPITWKGTIIPAVTKKPAKKPTKKPAKKKGQS